MTTDLGKYIATHAPMRHNDSCRGARATVTSILWSPWNESWLNSVNQKQSYTYLCTSFPVFIMFAKRLSHGTFPVTVWIRVAKVQSRTKVQTLNCQTKPASLGGGYSMRQNFENWFEPRTKIDNIELF